MREEFVRLQRKCNIYIPLWYVFCAIFTKFALINTITYKIT